MGYCLKVKSYVFRTLIFIFGVAVLSAILFEGIEKVGSFPNLALLMLVFLMIAFPNKMIYAMRSQRNY